jgi:thiol:disulfide interchange protein
MAAFFGDIAFLIGILVIAFGLLILHRASTDSKPKLLKIAGVLLIVAGIGTAICTSYFYLKYHLSGELERPYPIHRMSMMKDMQQMHQQHMEKMMGGNAGQMRNVMGDELTVASELSDEEHQSHHPDE